MGDPLFQKTGFEIAAASISKQYFNFTPPHPVDRNLIKKYGIETFLGHWLPYAALPNMVDDGEFQHFREELFTALNEQMPYICEAINRDYLRLELNGLINGNKAPAGSEKKLKSCKTATTSSIASGASERFSPCPTISATVNASGIPLSALTDTIDKQKSWNKSMYAVNKARQELSLAPLRQLQMES